MIRILTSLVALFTVTSIHTHAALNQFSRLLNEVVDEQKGANNSNLIRQSLSQEIFQQLAQRKTSDEKKAQKLFGSISVLNKQYRILSKGIKRRTVDENLIYYTSIEVFHIRSPNLFP